MARSSSELQRNSSGGSAVRALIVVAVVLLAGVAAVASTSPLGGSSSSLLLGGSRASVPAPWVLSLMIAGSGVALFVLIYSLRYGGGLRTARRRRAFGLVSAAQLAVLAAVAVLIVHVLGHTGRPSRPASFAHVAARARAGRAHGAGSPVLGWLPYIGLTAVVLADIAILAVAFAPRRRVRPAGAPAAEAAQAAIEASLEAPENEPDPRRAVIAAYRRMELALSEAGLPRGASESPREYLRRALGSLELSPAPLTTLTRLFERARFSVRRIGEAHRHEALSALVVLRDELEMERDAARS